MPDDLLLIEVDVLPKTSPKLSSDVFKIILDRFAIIRNTTPDEIKAINYRNVLRLIKDNPNLKDMFILMTETKI